MDSYYVLSYVDRMPPKRMSTSEALVLTHVTIEKLVAHGVATVLEAQATIMASTNNPNSKPRKTPVARKCAYNKFTSTNFSTSMKNKVRFAVSTLTKEALFWWNSFTQSIGIEEAYKITIESARATPKAHLPYTMFLRRLFLHVMEHYPYLDSSIYTVVEQVMRPLALRQTRRPLSDRGKARYSVSSTSAHHNRGSLSHQGDEDEDVGASCASTPSPTTYLNSLRPLDYQQYEVPTSSEQNDDFLFERQTDLLNQTQQMNKELRGGFKSFGKALRGVFGKKKK
ncbi:hypothetical protein Tco_0120761 [Tanacetum coccineum]